MQQKSKLCSIHIFLRIKEIFQRGEQAAAAAEEITFMSLFTTAAVGVTERAKSNKNNEAF
jgi:hypothetical protein